MTACSAPGCPARAHARGLCTKHYQRLRNTGSVRARTAEDRFFAKVAEGADGCWLWTGYVNPSGYGQFGDNGSVVLAHRWAWGFFRGEIPAGLQLDHLCRVRNCVNPDHLEPVTPSVNTRRARPFREYPPLMAVCGRGHEMTPENSGPRSDRPGQHYCRACMRIWQQNHKRRKGRAA